MTDAVKQEPDLERGLRLHLSQRPFAFAIWRQSELVALARRGAGQVDQTLDLGCGDGLFGEALFRPGTAVGIDRDHREVRRARARGVYRAVLQASVDGLPFRAGRFQLALANCVMEHVVPLEPSLREVARVLAPGGRFLFTVPSERFSAMLSGVRALEALGLHGLAGRYAKVVNGLLDHRHLLSPDTWRGLLATAGFGSVEVMPYAAAPVLRAFEAFGVLAAPSIAVRRATGRWAVLPKGPLHARLVGRLIGTETGAAGFEGAGLVIEARR